MTGRLRIAIPLFPQFTALDAIGPYEVLQRIPTFDITFIGHATGERVACLVVPKWSPKRRRQLVMRSRNWRTVARKWSCSSANIMCAESSNTTSSAFGSRCAMSCDAPTAHVRS